MQERRPFQPNVDESRLHSRQHPAYPTFVNITDQAAFAGALNQDFLQYAIFNNGDTGFRGGDIDQYFIAHAATALRPIRLA